MQHKIGWNIVPFRNTCRHTGHVTKRLRPSRWYIEVSRRSSRPRAIASACHCGLCHATWHRATAIEVEAKPLKNSHLKVTCLLFFKKKWSAKLQNLAKFDPFCPVFFDFWCPAFVPESRTSPPAVPPLSEAPGREVEGIGGWWWGPPAVCSKIWPKECH